MIQIIQLEIQQLLRVLDQASIHLDKRGEVHSLLELVLALSIRLLFEDILVEVEDEPLDLVSDAPVLGHELFESSDVLCLFLLFLVFPDGEVPDLSFEDLGEERVEDSLDESGC